MKTIARSEAERRSGFSYLRISTASQNTDTQRLAILDYAYQHHMTIDEFVVTQASSRRSPANRGIDSLIALETHGETEVSPVCSIQPADTLLVSELSRLGRSLSQIVQIIDKLVEQQVRFIAIKENIELEGSQDMKTKMMVAIAVRYCGNRSTPSALVCSLKLSGI